MKRMPLPIALIAILMILCTGAYGDRDLALIRAAGNGDLNKVQELLDNGVDVDSRNENGVTALMEAYGSGHVEIMKILLEWDADVNAADLRSGTTMLMAASALGQLNMVKLLLDWEADANKKANNGATALMLAAFQGHIDVVKLLLEAKADLHAKNENGATALMAASEKGHKDIVELLKNNGANE